MRLRYDEAGHGPAIVLLHARPADRTMWVEHLAVLSAAGYRAVAMDLPGYGESPLPTATAVAPWLDVLETLDYLDIDRAALIGNSLGALVALQVAVTAPERVGSMLLIGYRPHDQPASTELDAAWVAATSALEAQDLEAAVCAGVDAWTSTTAAPAVRDHAATMLAGNLRREMQAAPRAQAPDPLDDPAAWDALSMPIRVGVGENDMPDFFDGGQDLCRRLNTEPLITVPNAAHLVPLEQPAATCALILELVRNQPGTGDDPAVMFVTYRGSAGVRFDRDYYVAVHLPLVTRAWASLGLESIQALFPGSEQSDIVAVAICTFADAAAIDLALGSPESEAVMEDINEFTDLTPSRSRAVVMN